MNNTVEMTKALHYKLRMLVIRLAGPDSVYCDNEAVYKNFLLLSQYFKKASFGIVSSLQIICRL